MPFQSLNNLNNIGALSAGSIGSAFSPTNIAGLSLWFDANRSVFSDNGVTPAVNGDPVQQWNDLSASANNLTGSLTARPTYNTNVQNGLPGITFDGINDTMVTSAMTLAQPLSVFAVMNQKTWVSNGGMFDGLSSDTMLLYQNNVTPQLRIYATQGSLANLTTFTINTFGVLDAQYNGVSSFVRLNNGSKVLAGQSLTGTPGGLTLGKETGFGFGNVLYCEILIYNTALSDTNASQVNSYLGKKWGITVS